MILWFLRLFPQFRTLELTQSAELDETQIALEQALVERDNAVNDRERLQLLLEAAQDDRAKLWELVSQSITEERRAYQMHVNMSMQKQGAGVPYPDAPSIPVASLPKPQRGGYAGGHPIMRPSDLVRRGTKAYIRQVVEQAKASAGVS